MIGISITAEAYRAIKATLPDGADPLPPQPDGRLGVRIRLATEFVNRLGQSKPRRERERRHSEAGEGGVIAREASTNEPRAIQVRVVARSS